MPGPLASATRVALTAALLLAGPARGQDAVPTLVQEPTAPSTPRTIPSAAFPLVPPLALAPGACELPYLIDQHGIQRLFPHCLGAALALPEPSLEAPLPFTRFPPFPCDVPYHVDAGGIRRLILQCPLEIARSPQPDPTPPPAQCDLPYNVDEAGIRRIRPECL